MDRPAPFLFRSFGLASAYSFLSATVAGLAMNLFVSVGLDRNLDHVQRRLLYGASVVFILGAAALFSIAWNLDGARTQWIEEGAIHSSVALTRPIRLRMRKLKLGLVVAIAALISGFALMAAGSY